MFVEGSNWNTPDGEAPGPAKEIEEREKQKKSLPAYKDGIENGLVGVPSNSNEKFKIVQSLSTRRTRCRRGAEIIDEIGAILDQKQMDTLWKHVSVYSDSRHCAYSPDLTSIFQNSGTSCRVQYG